MLFKNIIALADGTSGSEQVIHFICHNIEAEAQIHIVYIIEVPRSLPLNQCPPQLQEDAKKVIEKVEEIALQYGAKIQTQIIFARTMEDALLVTAEDLKCDLIAIAQNNQKLRLLANAAQNVYQRAKCSVCLMNVK